MGLPFQSHTTNNNDSGKPEKSLPLLVFLGEFSGETRNAIYDPVQKSFRVVDFPELSPQLHCLASGHRWLLLLSRKAASLFFFNPLTRCRIDLPYRKSVFDAVTFSAPPTSPACTVFAIERDSSNGKFNFDLLHVAEKFWTRHEYSVGSSFYVSVARIVCCNGILYCVDLQGRISAFDTKDEDWKVLSGKHFRETGGSFLLEFNGEIFAVKRKNNGAVGKVYKVKFVEGNQQYAANWEEVNAIGDFTLFLGPHGACAYSGLGEELQEKTFLAEFDRASKCIGLHKFCNHSVRRAHSMKFHAKDISSLHAPVWI